MMQKLYTEAGICLPDIPWNRYPRPQMVRPDWLCLNGTWDLTYKTQKLKIVVPFCPESLLSGTDLTMDYGETLEYSRTFSVPESWAGKRVLLHFGAVSRVAEVFVNGTLVVRNEESYFPFSADITDALLPGENLLVVKAVNDVSCKHPWGKQKIKRGGMWYTPCSGIWQTVWLEPVPARFISALKITADEEKHCLRFSAGYGDFSLEHQRDFVRCLDVTRKLGITLSDSLLMTPTKSVTAVIGLGGNARTCGNKCMSCNNRNCIYRE